MPQQTQKRRHGKKGDDIKDARKTEIRANKASLSKFRKNAYDKLKKEKNNIEVFLKALEEKIGIADPTNIDNAIERIPEVIQDVDEYYSDWIDASHEDKTLYAYELFEDKNLRVRLTEMEHDISKLHRYDKMVLKFSVELYQVYGKSISRWAKEYTQCDKDASQETKKLMGERRDAIKMSLGLEKYDLHDEMYSIVEGIESVIKYYQSDKTRPKYIIPQKLLNIETWNPAKIAAWKDIVWRSAQQFLRQQDQTTYDLPAPDWFVRNSEGEVDKNQIHPTVWRANAASRFAVVL